MKSNKFSTEEFFRMIAPRLRNFGRYALNIQRSIYSFEKDDPKIDPAVAVVTDGDYMVQEGLLRTIFYELGYKKIKAGMEEISPYSGLFSKNSDIRIEIDPIDGTLAYKKGIDNWCIVLSIYKKGLLDGTLVHTPWDGKIYCATQSIENSFVYDSKGNKTNLEILLKSESKNITLTHFLPKEKQKKLEKLGIEVNQVNEPKSKYPFVGLNSIYRGELGAWYKENAPARDWGSMSLIVEKAGGIVTYYDGSRENIHQYFNRKDKTPRGCLPSIIVSLDKFVHEKIIKGLEK